VTSGARHGVTPARSTFLPLQETVDRLASAVATNQLTFATQNILIPKGILDFLGKSLRRLERHRMGRVHGRSWYPQGAPVDLDAQRSF
jgi:hypothetical protein